MERGRNFCMGLILFLVGFTWNLVLMLIDTFKQTRILAILKNQSLRCKMGLLRLYGEHFICGRIRLKLDLNALGYN